MRFLVRAQSQIIDHRFDGNSGLIEGDTEDELVQFLVVHMTGAVRRSISVAGELRDQLMSRAPVVLSALALWNNQIAETAAFLGISRANLWERMRRLEMKS